MLTMLDEFAGIGGATIAGDSLGIKTTQFIEIDPDAKLVLKYRFPNIPIHNDIRTYHPKPGEHDIHWVSFPCTGTSIAGNGSGLNHPESSLWFEALRCIDDGRPSFIIIENPEGLIHRGLRAILGGLRMAGYQWDDPQLISAKEIGAPHQRNRLFIVAYTNNISQRLNGMQTSWADQIRAEIETLHNQERQVKPSSTRVDDGLPGWLGRKSIDGWWRDNISAAPVYPGVRHHLNKRRSCNDLYARSVCPVQAAIALRRVLYLNSLI